MSTARERDGALREAALRRALLSAAEQIEPASGGLERIQAKLQRPRPAAVAWLGALWTCLMMRAPDYTDAVRRSGAAALRLVSERFGPRPAHGSGSNRLSWLRPLAATSVAVFVIGAGIYVGLDTPAFISQTGSTGPGGTQVGSGSSSQAGGSTDGSASPGHSLAGGLGDASGATASPSTCPPSPAPFRSTPGASGNSIEPASPSSGTSGSGSSPAPSPSLSTSPGQSSSSPAAGGSAQSPDAGQTGGDSTDAGDTPAATTTSQSASDARKAAGSHNGKASDSAASSPAAAQDQPGSGSQKYTDCVKAKKAKKKRHTTSSSASAATLTSVQVTAVDPADTVAAKLS